MCNFQEPKIAFEDVNASELYPCVMFYSSNPGEKVSKVASLAAFSEGNHFSTNYKPSQS